MYSKEETRRLSGILIQKALSNEHAPFVLVKNIDHYRVVKIYRKSMRKLIGGFKQMKKDSPNPQLWDTCIEFYKEEIKTLTSMIKEFKCYLWSNRHTLRTLLGMPRSEDERVDYRMLPISFF